MARWNDTIADRFWPKLQKLPPDGCWLWLGRTDRYGYGRYGRLPAHRLAYTLAYGPVPSGMCVCHRCDVRNCCNPYHLFVGTVADNHADRNAKGRQARGERSGNATLNASDIAAIRKSKATQVVLAQRFGVSQAHISRIIRGESWI